VTRVAKAMVSVVGRKSAARFDAVTQSVAASQLRKLEQILERNAATEYGREYGFSAIHSLSDYTRAVPVIQYEAIAERVDRMAAGETNVLTAEAPIQFARTSGTTGKPKLIPVTPTCRGRDHADQMRTWLFHAQKAHPGMFSGKVLSLVSPAEEGRTSAGIPFGSTSGDIYRNIPALVRSTYVVPYPVFEIEDHDAEFYAILRLGIAADVSFLCTANPSSITKLCEFTDAHAEELIRDVRDGTLKQDLTMSREQRALVESACKPDPDLARRLDEMRERRGRLLPGDYWPNLDLIGCWKGGTVGAHVDGFGAWFDPDGTSPKAVRDWGYLSSEARGSIPLTDEGAGGVLTVGTNVYEFVDVDQLDAAPEDPSAWTFLGAHEVDSPRDYYVFITTTGGLYRYDINDIVRVEGFYNEAPIITFQRKGRGMTSLTGEKVSDMQVIEAVTSAASESGVGLAHFRALADVESARYVFQVESKNGAISKSQGRGLLESIERKLTSLNIEYEGKRKSQRLAGPELQVMKPGWYERGKQDQGQRLFQSKTVVLEPKEEKEHSIRSQEMCVSRIELEPRAKG